MARLQRSHSQWLIVWRSAAARSGKWLKASVAISSPKHFMQRHSWITFPARTRVLMYAWLLTAGTASNVQRRSAKSPKTQRGRPQASQAGALSLAIGA